VGTVGLLGICSCVSPLQPLNIFRFPSVNSEFGGETSIIMSMTDDRDSREKDPASETRVEHNIHGAAERGVAVTDKYARSNSEKTKGKK
jgi:hypothetical protein